MSESYLVFSREHNAFWRPKRCGYTHHTFDAGRYSKQEAIELCENGNIGCHTADPDEVFVGCPDAIERLQARVELLEKYLIANSNGMIRCRVCRHQTYAGQEIFHDDDCVLAALQEQHSE